MSFLGRISLKPTQALLLGLSATVLGATSHAADDTRFTLTAYTDSAGGREIIDGNYNAALATIGVRHSHVGTLDSTALEINKCVALTLSHNWPAAGAACDSAVHAAQHEKLAVPAWAVQERHEQDVAAAIAFSNRAVLHWLTSDLSAANQDMKQARSLAPDSDIIARNVVALSAHSAVAQVDSLIAPKR